ncbi:MAG: phosphate signaling complex protein PhoU [Anaerolineae bacterium]|jgi:phosphate transport system protein|nr:phosphate signaling complex protein PhoU [Anaerolineae bacterium]
MTREYLDRRVHQLEDEILLLGSMVEQAVLHSVETLRTQDTRGAKAIIEDDIIINEKRYAIENAILITIATQQPVGRDLRRLAAMLEVSTELERMGDYAKGIAKVTMRLVNCEIEVPYREINQMAELSVGMLHRALGAFIAENPNVASAIPAEDDLVDELYNRVYHTVVNLTIQNPEIVDKANHIMWVAHNLERMADRVTNICERTVFIATGELLDMDTSDDEDDIDE